MKTTKGYSVIELLGVLVILAFIFIITNHYINDINQSKQYNQLADQTVYFNNVAIKYVIDNYRNLDKSVQVNDMVIPYGAMLAYSSIGGNDAISRKLKPCLYLTNGVNNNLNAYLYLGQATSLVPNFSYLTATKVAQNIGGNTGVLVKQKSGYIVKGNLFNNFTLSDSQANTIANNCGFIGGALLTNTVVIAVNQDQRFFASLQTKVDQQSQEHNQDPSLKRTGSGDDVTMQTNLYLDNVIKESSLNKNYYCDASKLPTQGAVDLCQAFAQKNSFILNNQTAQWTGSTLDSKTSCLSFAQADFAENQYGYTCNGVSYGDIYSFCPASMGNQNILSGTGYWQANPNNPVGNQCNAVGYAQYQQPPNCSFPCTSLGTHDLYTCAAIDGLCDQAHGWWPRGVGTTFQGAYIGNNQCHVEFWCSNTGDNYSKVNTNIPANNFPINTNNCGSKDVGATPTTTPVDIGIHSCGSIVTNAFESDTYFPGEHIYKSLDFGRSADKNKRIQIRSDAPFGAPVSTSQLDINNAGLQAGYISPISHPIDTGSACDSSDMGKMAQQFNPIGAGGQLQCSYNPTYCQGAGYCYLPVKSSGIILTYKQLVQDGHCPTGTMVDQNQPSDGISSNVTCPSVSGLSFQKIEGIQAGAYTSVTGFTFYSDYQTFCLYKDGSGNPKTIPIAALAKLLCTSSVTTFTVDHYRPTN